MEKDFNNIQKIRDYLYELFITNISSNKILVALTERLCARLLSFKSKALIIQNAILYDHRLLEPRREIVHLDAYVISVIKLLLIDDV